MSNQWTELALWSVPVGLVIMYAAAAVCRDIRSMMA